MANEDRSKCELKGCTKLTPPYVTGRRARFCCREHAVAARQGKTAGAAPKAKRVSRAAASAKRAAGPKGKAFQGDLVGQLRERRAALVSELENLRSRDEIDGDIRAVDLALKTIEDAAALL
jgi:hypothetical protein